MIGEKIHGFTITKIKHLPELSAELIQMLHDRTALELVWLKREEENKTFGIAFGTPPWNDTGVFHILEHSVLCGSDRYPIKEPFVELMKSSMNTFLNAMTFSDKTFYPISSRNDKDFINLMRVYLDAVFCPLIYAKPDIFYQEGWHYEIDDNGTPSYKGVVFNEMKGAFASADRQIGGMLNQLLFPDTPYQYESGGDPATIPDLTYEDFLETHRRFYAPSNAYVYLDGALDIEMTLGIINDEYLSHYEKTERIAPPTIQNAISKKGEGHYELVPNEKLEGKTRLAYGKVIGTFADREKLIGMKILSEVLCGNNQSILCKAILAENLAEEVNMGISDGILQPWLMLDIKNVKEENVAKVEDIISSQLHFLVEKGLDATQLEAVMANIEFKLRERDYGYYPQGLIFGFNVLESWLYGGDPAANLEVGDLFIHLHKKLKEGYFEKLINDVLLDNPHCARVILHPSHTIGEERRALEAARLEVEVSNWTDREKMDIIEKQENLIVWQNSVDTPEMLGTIPQLSLEDIPMEPEQIPTEILKLYDIPVIVHPIQTGGIAYVNMYFDADSCTEKDLSYLSFACSLLGETNTKTQSAEEITNAIRLLCGNLNFYPGVYNEVNQPDRMTRKLCVSFSTLKHNLPKALELVMNILKEPVFINEMALDILRQTKMQIFQRIVMAGNSVGLGRIGAQTCAGSVVEECIGGVTYYEWLKNQEENWKWEEMNQRLSGLLYSLVNRRTLTVSITGGNSDDIGCMMDMLLTNLPEKEVLAKVAIKPWGRRKEGIIIPADVSFAVMGGNVVANGAAFSGQLQLAGQIISLGYLWNTIRVQGGAYGAGMITRDTGLVACYSYRDPNGANSVESYRNCGSFLRDFSKDTSDFTGFIIGTVANNSPLMTPRTKAQTADKFYFTKMEWADRCRLRKELLSTKAGELIGIAETLENIITEGGICMIGGQKQLDLCKELKNIITL